MLGAEFWNSAVEHWEPDARSTFERFEDDEIVVVAGPWGIGKSRLYSRALERICDARGIAATSKFRHGIEEEPVSPHSVRSGQDIENWLKRETDPALLEHQGLMVWFEEPQLMERYGSIDNLDAWRAQRREEGKKTHIVINRALRTYRLREAAVDALRDNVQSDAFVSFQELQRDRLPKSLLLPSLAGLGVQPELLDFTADAENRALRNPRMTGLLYSDSLAVMEEASVDEVPPVLPKTLRDLRSGIDNLGISMLYERAIGGSARDLTRMLRNLGMFEPHPEAFDVAEQFLRTEADNDDEGNYYTTTLLYKMGIRTSRDLYFD